MMSASFEKLLKLAFVFSANLNALATNVTFWKFGIDVLNTFRQTIKNSGFELADVGFGRFVDLVDRMGDLMLFTIEDGEHILLGAEIFLVWIVVNYFTPYSVLDCP